jgi:hypothetical protein
MQESLSIRLQMVYLWPLDIAEATEYRSFNSACSVDFAEFVQQLLRRVACKPLEHTPSFNLNQFSALVIHELDLIHSNLKPENIQHGHNEYRINLMFFHTSGMYHQG